MPRGRAVDEHLECRFPVCSHTIEESSRDLCVDGSLSRSRAMLGYIPHKFGKRPEWESRAELDGPRMKWEAGGEVMQSFLGGSVLCRQLSCNRPLQADFAQRWPIVFPGKQSYHRAADESGEVRANAWVRATAWVYGNRKRQERDPVLRQQDIDSVLRSRINFYATREDNVCDRNGGKNRI
jgi:hypothetical protein